MASSETCPAAADFFRASMAEPSRDWNRVRGFSVQRIKPHESCFRPANRSDRSCFRPAVE
jgi:hypothetical protein